MKRLVSSLAFIASLVLSLSDSQAAAAANCSTECTTSGAHIIVARESGAPNSVSVMDALAEEVVLKCSGSSIAGVPYPADFNPYVESEGEGVGNLTEMVLDYQTCCPDSKVVLMGYSQVIKTSMDLTHQLACPRNEMGMALPFPFPFIHSSVLMLEFHLLWRITRS